MKVIVSLQRFDSGDQVAMTTSCGATACQVLRSQSDYQTAIMRQWAEEQESAAARRVIWEINYDLANWLLTFEDIMRSHGATRLPADLVAELIHRFPELKNGQRDTRQGSGQSGKAESGSQTEAPV